MQWLSVCGLLSVLALGASAFKSVPSVEHPPGVQAGRGEAKAEVRLLAVGDVNLGRLVGQEILRGDTLYPFAAVKDTFAQYDIVFANLESQLSDQKGETQHPGNNLIFTGPPGGAYSLSKSGVTIVSTANNHAIDYGIKGLRETIRYLDHAGVLRVGTSNDSATLFAPVVLVRNGIRIAFFACTDVMNIENPVWKKYVAEADTGQLFPAVRSFRDSADLVVLSYHGGEEYADVPTQRTKEFARSAVHNGVDLFLGHHPHVPYGVEEVDGKYIVHSLGNFVFRQPDRFWTQRSYAFEVRVLKTPLGTRVSGFRLLPVKSGLQPVFTNDQGEIGLILERTRSLSSQSLTPLLTWSGPLP
jgi:poly-gamma-glutamate synthesis protein (capsule biosynthesis protein)